MSKSSRLRSEDFRAIFLLVGECQELGDERTTWRRHFIERMALLVEADVGYCGEMAGIRTPRPTDLGVVDWGLQNGLDRAAQIEVYETIERDPSTYGALKTYFERAALEDGTSLSRRDIIDDAEWYSSSSYQQVHRPRGIDHILWCMKSIDDGRGDVSSGLFLERVRGRRDFSARHRSIVSRAHASLAPFVGRSLARFADPSPLELTPRARGVLGCLLEGDGDKQIATRLKISPLTVNQHTKQIYQHFGVSGRAELLARWIRRGYSSRFTWLS